MGCLFIYIFFWLGIISGDQREPPQKMSFMWVPKSAQPDTWITNSQMQVYPNQTSHLGIWYSQDKRHIFGLYEVLETAVNINIISVI